MRAASHHVCTAFGCTVVFRGFRARFGDGPAIAFSKTGQSSLERVDVERLLLSRYAMRARFALALWTLLFTVVTLHAAEKPKAPVFVKGVATAPTNGFVPVGSDLGDSVKDLRKHLMGSRKHIRPAESETEAKVTIEVLSRGMEADDEIHVLTVRMTAVGGYTEDLTVKDDSTYRNCALKIMRKVDAFVAANRERLK